MNANVIFISKGISEKGIIKEIETYLRINRNMNIHFAFVDEVSEAWQRLSDASYDLVILDMDTIEGPVMPVLEKFKKDYNVLVMVITSDLSEEIGILAMDNGADDIEYKPLRQIEFLMKLSNLVRMKVYQKKLEEEQGILKQFVSEEIADHVINEQSSMGIKTYATILFFDIQGSTSLAETESPLYVATLLNDVINRVIDLIYKNLGSVNNIIGDGIIATFGYPVVYEYDAIRAVNCIHDIRELFASQPFDRPLGYGVGVATGAVFSGNIGNYRKMANPVLGDPVNLASRLQGLTRRAGVDALIDETTREAAAAYIRARHFRGKVKGKKDMVDCYWPAYIDVHAIGQNLEDSNKTINSNISDIGEIEYF